MSSPKADTSVAPMFQDLVMEFPYKHSTGEDDRPLLAGLEEQKKIWGQRVARLGVVVPPLGYSESTPPPRASGSRSRTPARSPRCLVHPPIDRPAPDHRSPSRSCW